MALHPKPLLPHLQVDPTPSPLQLPIGPLLPLIKVPELHTEEHHTHALRLAMIVMASMLGVALFLCTLSIVLKNFYSRRRNRNQNRSETPILFDVNEDSPISDNDDEESVVVHPIWFIRTVGLQQSFIDSITVFKYRKDEGLVDGTECSVCLGEFEHDESLRLLPKCSHAFHIPCIDMWLRSHKNCPLCRAPVFHDNGGGRAATNQNQTDSNVSDQNQSRNQEAQTENSDGGVGLESHHVGEGERSEDDSCGVSSSGILLDKMEIEEEIQPMRRSVSMDLSSASVTFGDVVMDVNSDRESSDTQLGEKVNLRGKGKDMSMMTVVAKHGIGSSSSTIYKLASVGRALQKKPISMRRSFSHNRKCLFSRHCRSQSSTLPL